MSKLRLVTGCASLALAWNHVCHAAAQTMLPAPEDPAAVTVNLLEAPAPVPPQTPPAPQAPQCPAPPTFPAPATPPAAPVFAEAAPAGTEAGGGAFNPQMLGDSLVVVTGSAPSGTFLVVPLLNPRTGNVQTLFAGNVPVPFALSGFKIADNEGPRPECRLFLTFNYFAHVFHGLDAPGQVAARELTPTPFLQALGLNRFPDLRVAREMFGFEKTFWNGDASIGMRVPFFQLHNEEGASFSDVGDVTFITKFALLNDPGRVLSAGLALTVPSGPTFVTLPLVTTNIFATPVSNGEKVNPTIVQPYIAYLFKGDNWYVHGFSSLAFFTDDSVGTEWYNDIGVGWYAYRGTESVNSVVPTAELHLTTPFGHQGSQGFPVGQIDALIATLGTHFILRNAVFTLGVEFPLTGPQPFTTEWVAQFNYHF